MSQALSPVLMVLVAISGSLVLVGLSAVVALCVCRRPPTVELKQQLQHGAHAANGLAGNGPNGDGRMVLIVRTPSGPNGPVVTSGAPAAPDDLDPDVIPSNHGKLWSQQA